MILSKSSVSYGEKHLNIITAAAILHVLDFPLSYIFNDYNENLTGNGEDRIDALSSRKLKEGVDTNCDQRQFT